MRCPPLEKLLLRAGPKCSLRNTRATRSEVQRTRNGARRGRRHGGREPRNVPRGQRNSGSSGSALSARRFISDSHATGFHGSSEALKRLGSAPRLSDLPRQILGAKFWAKAAPGRSRASVLSLSISIFWFLSLSLISMCLVSLLSRCFVGEIDQSVPAGTLVGPALPSWMILGATASTGGLWVQPRGSGRTPSAIR